MVDWSFCFKFNNIILKIWEITRSESGEMYTQSRSLGVSQSSFLQEFTPFLNFQPAVLMPASKPSPTALRPQLSFSFLF